MTNKFDFVKLVKLSDDKKKFKVILKNNETGRQNTIKFGAAGFENYTSGHLDEQRRENYISRHKKREDWTKSGVNTAGFWSYWFLWKFKTYKEALDYIKTNFFD
jgi:hypothetical protein